MAGISGEELAGYTAPAAYARPVEPVPQPANDPDKPHLAYPPEVYARLLATPDAAFLHAVSNEPPVQLPA